MESKNIIVEICKKLNSLAENVQDTDNLDENTLIEFYNNAQKLQESINQLKNNSEEKQSRDPEKGLYPDQVMDLMNYIQKNNSWMNIYNCYVNKRIPFKYYTMRVDTRTGTVWSVTFDEKDTTFRTEKDYNLSDAIYDFLNKK